MFWHISVVIAFDVNEYPVSARAGPSCTQPAADQVPWPLVETAPDDVPFGFELAGFEGVDAGAAGAEGLATRTCEAEGEAEGEAEAVAHVDDDHGG